MHVRYILGQNNFSISIFCTKSLKKHVESKDDIEDDEAINTVEFEITTDNQIGTSGDTDFDFHIDVIGEAGDAVIAEAFDGPADLTIDDPPEDDAEEDLTINDPPENVDEEDLTIDEPPEDEDEKYMIEDEEEHNNCGRLLEKILINSDALADKQKRSLNQAVHNFLSDFNKFVSKFSGDSDDSFNEEVFKNIMINASRPRFSKMHKYYGQMHGKHPSFKKLGRESFVSGFHDYTITMTN